jgi:hypothetical protein
MMATILALPGAVPVLTLWTPVGPQHLAGRLISVLVAVCCAIMAVMWLIRCPSRRQSVLFILMATACIAAACLVHSSPGMSLLGCTAFAALAGDAAFFHTSRYLAIVLSDRRSNLDRAAKLAMEGSVLVALAKLLIIAVGVLAVPFSVHVLD